MAGVGVSSIGSHKIYRGLTTVLASAFLEWLLMFLLFVDAIFAYLIAQFARYCELPVPCVLCSRLDHIFDGQRVEFYWDLICGNHKSEISSLVLCHFHNKLVDVHRMCENCLFSFAMKDKSNAETYRLVVGKLGDDENIDIDEAPLHGDHKPNTSRVRTCSCCGQSWSSRPQTRSLLQTKSSQSEGSDLHVPLFHEFRQGGNIGEATRLSAESAAEDSSPSFMYTELKITSATESECDKSDSGNSVALVSDAIDYHEDIGVGSMQMECEIGTLGDGPSHVMEHCNKDSRASALDTNYSKEDIGVECGQTEQEIKTPAEVSTSVIGTEIRALAEDSTHITAVYLVSVSDNEDSRPLVCQINNTQEDLAEKTVEVEHLTAEPRHNSTHGSPVELGIVEDEYETSAAPQQADICKEHDGSCSSIVSRSATGHGSEELNWDAGVTMVHPSPAPELIDINGIHGSAYAGDEKGNPISLSELVVMDRVPESSSFVDGLQQQSDGTVKAGEVEQAPVVEGVKKMEVANESIIVDDVGSKMITDPPDSGVQIGSNLDLGDAYKLAVSNRERQLSAKLFEQQHPGKDSTRISGDLRLLWSQLSSPRGFDLPVKDLISPRVSGNLDEYWKSHDPCTSIGMQSLQKRFSPERSDSRISLNESSTDSLDLNIVGEIEGESEVDRLKRQVEHDRKIMIALCKELEEERNASAISANQAMAMITRLQEEKATVQMEALQNLRIMEEEAEFDAKAHEKLNDLLEEKEREIEDLELELEIYRRNFPDEKNSENLTSTLQRYGSQQTYEMDGGSDGQSAQNIKSLSKDTSFEFEDEALYISRRLTKLEKKLQLFSDTGLYAQLGMGDENLTNSKMQEDGPRITNEAEPFTSRGNRRSSVRRFYSFRNPRSVAQGSMVNKEAEETNLAYELSSLNDRLLALEADRNFLERVIKSLRNGEEGLHFIQDIASDLRELRRIGVRRQQTLA